jgi:hypothetical protein
VLVAGSLLLNQNSAPNRMTSSQNCKPISTIELSYYSDSIKTTRNEVQWVNDYNLEVRDKLIPLLQDDQKTIKWLNDNTQAV